MVRYTRIVRKTISQTEGWFDVIARGSKVRGSITNEPPSRVVVGIDPSITGTGLAVFRDGELDQFQSWSEVKKLHTQHRGTIIYYKPKEATIEARLARIRMITDWIGERLTELTMHGDHVTVAIEGLAFGARGRGVSDLYELSGQIKQTLLTLGIDFRIYDPSSIKLAATGSGSADKGDMKVACIKTLGLDVTRFGKAGENIADSCLIAWMLEQELSIKAGRLTLKKAPTNVRQVMLRVTKAQPVALISQEFINSGTIDIAAPLL